VRCTSRPETITREPFLNDAAASSAGCRHAEQRKKPSVVSCHCPSWRSLRDTATVKLATASSLWVEPYGS
jgi:hypothetical protein